MVFCNQGDGVCGGAFSISAAHLSYTSNGTIQKGVDFVASVMANPDIGQTSPKNPNASSPPVPGGALTDGGMPKGGGSVGGSKGTPKGAPKGSPKGGGVPKGPPPRAEELPKTNGSPQTDEPVKAEEASQGF
jgi:hypothetical protein